MISSQQSCTTFDGGGSAAPGREPSACQISSSRPMMTSGGSTCETNTRPAFATTCTIAPGGRAAPTGSASTISALLIRGAPSCGLDGLDGQAVQVFLRVGRVEHLSVEELLDAARRRFRDVLVGHAQLLRRCAPDVF